MRRLLCPVPKPMVQHFQRDGIKLVIAAIGIEQIVRHHGIQIGTREGQSDAVKSQQGAPSGHGRPSFLGSCNNAVMGRM